MSVDPFMIRAHVPHWEASVADYRAASAATRRAHPDRRTPSYGEGPDERLDLFIPAGGTSGDGRPIHLFVHGGYWRSFSKDDYAFVAEPILADGAVAAILDYSLMPAARMGRLVAQVRRAAAWLAEHAHTFGGDPDRLSASGHSAGAHLASYLVAHGPGEPDLVLPPVRAVLLVSGLYDLAPIANSFLQAEIQLTTAEIAQYSPLGARFVSTASVGLLVGARETPPFHEQAAALAAHLEHQGIRNGAKTIPDEDHMTIIRSLGRPGSACARHLGQAIRAAREG